MLEFFFARWIKAKVSLEELSLENAYPVRALKENNGKNVDKIESMCLKDQHCGKQLESAVYTPRYTRRVIFKHLCLLPFLTKKIQFSGGGIVFGPQFGKSIS